MHVLVEKAGASRAAILRLEKKGCVFTWEEALTTAEDAWDTDFVPPANVLNPEQNAALGDIWRWLVADKFVAGLSCTASPEAGRRRFIWGDLRRRLSLREIRDRAGAGNRAHAVGRAPGRARFGETRRQCCTARCRTIERAREWWRVRHGHPPHGRRDAIGDLPRRSRTLVDHRG